LIVDDLVDRVIVDPRIEGIFRASDLVRLRRTLKEQFCYLLGGPCDYTGRDMVEAHKDQGITMREFNALVESLQLAMDTEGVPFAMQNRLIAKLAPMQRDVVTR
ncbi:MAG: group 1 truncated hemoglobin, partial [Alphaproteobacteria bacterium]|nr:group 1 truncated hemoglobin [Alphaproteobacteria bacterium]